MALNKIEDLKNKVKTYKKKIGIASSCTTDIKNKVLDKKSCINICKTKDNKKIEESFIPEEIK